MNRYLWIGIFLAGLGLGCGDDGNTDNRNTGSDPTTTASGTPSAAPVYPSVPADTIRALFNACDYIDYVFYYTNFSVSQKEQRDIQTAISYIASETPEIGPNCKPVGRIFYQVDGENRLEADLYFSQGCMYYLFYQDGQPAYANRIMPAGIDFYTKIFQSTQ